jgi:hypothetical protein
MVSRNMSNVLSLRAHDRLVTTPFGLLGTGENALSFPLGYTFQQCRLLLQWFLRQVGVPGVRSSSLSRAEIYLQRHRSGELEQGITDIEIHLPGHFHVIVEAKIGMAVPTIKQCRKYVGRFHEVPNQKLVALIQSPDQALLEEYRKQDPALRKRLVGFQWADFIPECIRLMLGGGASAQEKEWARSFYSFLDQEYPMKAFTTEVWILPINTDPLWPNGMNHWDIHRKYKVWWHYKYHTVRPLYLAFRVHGILDSIYRVRRIEHGIPIIDLVPELRKIRKEWPKELATIWHFEEPVKLAKTLRTGVGMYAKSVRCDLDLLLSCDTVQEIEFAMKKRRLREEL